MRKKKFLSLLLTFAMIMCLMPMKISGSSEEGKVSLSISADKTEAHPGDVITYTVKMGPVPNCSSFGFKLVIQEGLTYVDLTNIEIKNMRNNIREIFLDENEDSTVTYDQDSLTLGVIGLNYTETNSTTKNIMTFKCTVDNNATGDKEVTFDSNNTQIADTAPNPNEYGLNLTGATTTIKVNPDGVSLDSHELDETSNDINKTETLTATISPSGATGTLNWSTDNSSVASVVGNNDNTATVTISGVGTAHITVTIQGTSYSDSCTVTVSEYVCPHENKTETAAKAATCTEEGNNKYYYCEDCQKYLKADGTTVTTREAETIPALGHNYENVAYSSDDTQHWKVCSRCNEDSAKENHTWGNATYTWSNDNSKCTATHVCTVCGKEVTETVNSTSQVTAATCTEGEKTRYTATFTKPGFEAQTKDGVETSQALGHEWGETTYTWSDDNSKCTATRVCTRDASHKEEETVDAAVITTATCTEAGTTTYTAMFTNGAFNENDDRIKEVAVDALGHNFEWIITKEVTDTEDGMMEEICSRCQEKREEKVVPALDKGETKELESSVPMNGQNLGLIIQDPYEALPDGTKLVVDLAEPGSERHNELSNQYDGTYNVENIAFFDINLLDLYDNKLPMPLPREVRALLQIPEGWDKGDLEAVLIASGADVEFEESVVTIDGADYLAFWTNHFTPYAMIDKLTDEEAAELAKLEAQNAQSPKGASEIKTGESIEMFMIFGEVLILASAMLWIAIKRKRDLE